MIRAVSLLVGCLLLASGPAQAGPRSDRTPEAKLARALAGRVARAPVDCINLRDVLSGRIISRTAILYEAAGGKLYVNRPESGLRALDPTAVMVTETHSSQLCSIDTVRLVDPASRTMRGVIFLGPFVPYEKPRTASRD